MGGQYMESSLYLGVQIKQVLHPSPKNHLFILARLFSETKKDIILCLKSMRVLTHPRKVM